MDKFVSGAALVRALNPEVPVQCIRPTSAREAVRPFLDRFGGKIFYAVKANPHTSILDALWDEGVRAFDVASEAEIRLISDRFPEAELALMHPVKSRACLRFAWSRGVRTFSLDHVDELRKVVQVLGEVQADLSEACFMIRLAVPDGDSGVCLAGKFGATPDEAPDLLFAARQLAGRVGVCFHVGSQAMRAGAYEVAMELAGQVIRDAGVLVDVVDVGGGFPVSYPGLEPADLDSYFAAIHRGWENMPVTEACELWAEPGRALCASSGSVIARVELRKGNRLYLNDGTYGGLFDAGSLGFRYPTRVIHADGRESIAPERAFELFGPTCDGLDHMKGPFWLPEDIDEGDWVELGQLGAYSLTLRTNFNGFGDCMVAEVEDAAPVCVPVQQGIRRSAV